jgi:hypothetical protein
MVIGFFEAAQGKRRFPSNTLSSFVSRQHLNKADAQHPKLANASVSSLPLSSLAQFNQN